MGTFKLRKVIDKLLNLRDVALSIIRFIFFISVLLSFIAFWYTLIINSSGFNSEKYSSEGLQYLLIQYKTSINVGTAFLAILAIYLTMRRMSQTQTQIEVMSANNQFNNFYRHRDEFIKFFKDKIIINDLISVLDNSPIEIITVFYGKYFSNNFNEFSPYINQKTRASLTKFVTKLKDSNLNRGHFDFSAFEASYLKDYIDLFDYHWPDITGIIQKKCERQKDFRDKYYALSNKDQTTQFHLLFCIYFTITTASIVFAFEGSDIKGFSDYYRNYDQYLKNCGLFNNIVRR